MNMKNVYLALVVGVGMMLTGCSSFYMKASPFYDGPDSAYNEPAEQRVNLWPLLYNRDPALSVIWPLYTQCEDSWYAWPLLTWKDKNDWISLPLLTWKDKKDFYSVPLLSWTDGEDFVSLPILTWKHGREWTSLPLLSGYKRYYKGRKSENAKQFEDYKFLLGLERITFTNGVYSSSTAFPLYADNEDGFYSLCYCHHADDSWFIPPLLLGSEKNKENGNDYNMLLLGGCSTDTNGYTGSYFFPLYAHGKDKFISLPFGMTDTSWWVLPLWIHRPNAEYGLMGLCGKSESSWWFLPAAIGTDKGFYGALGLLGWRYDGPNWCLPLYWADPKENHYASLLAGHVDGYTWWCTPLVSTYEDKDGSGFWAWPLFGWSTEPDRERVWWLGGIPLWSREKTATGSSESLLWRLWHKETKDGNVTVDCFPGITYDSHPDGYEKTSFLWRCYRNETIPGKGRNLDVLFIPFSSAE